MVMLLPCVAHAQDASPPPLPDPATIAVPDVTPSKDPKVRKDGYKFYYFHSSEVTFVQAWQDFRECRGYLIPGGLAQVPGFIPWDEAHILPIPKPGLSPYGLIGEAIGAVIVPKVVRGQRSNKMRRCMETRGYQRYAIPEETWERINSGDEDQIILMQAKLASGPKPLDEAVSK